MSWRITSLWGKAFARVGGPEEAPPLLLLHGFPQSHAMWHRVAPDLARDHRVICLDLKGYGWSAAPADGPPQTTVTRAANGQAPRAMSLHATSGSRTIETSAAQTSLICAMRRLPTRLAQFRVLAVK